MTETAVEEPSSDTGDVVEEEDTDEEEDSNSIGSLEAFFGLLSAYYAISGAVAFFIYLRWLGIGEALIQAMAPFEVAGQAILGVVSLFISFLFLSVLLVNGERVSENLGI